MNRDKNKALLEDIPHVDFLDLAICFYYSYEHPELGQGMIQIHNTHMEMWGTCHRELMQIAERNTPGLFPAQLCGMDSALKGILDEEALGDLRLLRRKRANICMCCPMKDTAMGRPPSCTPESLRRRRSVWEAASISCPVPYMK